MSSAKRSVKDASFPEDLILEVFLRLPWKSLLRFRFLSKRLRESIDSPQFLKQYDFFNNYVSDFSLMHIKSGKFFSIDFHHTDSSFNCSEEKQIRVPNKRNFVFIGCCKGIVCLMVSLRKNSKKESYILLNPFNRTFQNVDRINPCPLNNDIESYSIGFGYDYATDDYKILRMARVTKDCAHFIEVYSMKRDSWTQLNGVFSIGSFAHLNGVCVQNALHWLWLNEVNGYSCIAAIDLKTEALRILPLPPHYPDPKVEMSLNDLGGRLSVSVLSGGRIIVWVMDEYGADETNLWTWVLYIVTPSTLNGVRQIKLICYFPMRDTQRFICFGIGSDSAFGIRFNTDCCSMNSEIHKVPCEYATKPWVCVRSATRLPCSQLQKI